MSLKQGIKKAMVATADLSPIRKALGHSFGSQASVFMLHRFNCPELGVKGHDPAFVGQCMAALHQRGYQLVTVDDILKGLQTGQPLQKAVSFTVDDGYLDQALVGGPLFKEYDCPATYYNITRFIDGDYWPTDARINYVFENTPKTEITVNILGSEYTLPADTPAQRNAACNKVIWLLKEVSQALTEEHVVMLSTAAEVEIPQTPPDSEKAMDWDESNRLCRQGCMIGAHTLHHALLSKEDAQTSDREIRQSRERLFEKAENPSNVFCYPTGRYADYGEREINTLLDCGFDGATIAEPGYYGPANTEQASFHIPRFALPNNLDDFLQCVLYVEYLKERFGR